ncbi:MAG: hypothetical protein WC231_04725 [Dehalococcoidales bacterium]|jgi:hypothetical protein|nr:hypothetical protein [Dehalococcoidales bacterium]
MSLSDFSHFARSILDELFQKPEFTLKEPIKAVPLTRNYQTLGAGFDYALRILVSKLNANIVNAFPLTARGGIKGDKRRLQFIEDFEEKRTQFARGDVSISCLLADCIILAKLEAVARTGNNFPNSQIFDVDERDVEDLLNLMELVNPRDFKANHTCVLNPVFGKSSLDVGGADADIIIDSTLIDIKTTKYLKFTREYFRQLIGYYILNKRERFPYGVIDHLGIYYARFGMLFTFQVPPIIEDVWRNKETGEELASWKVVEEAIKDYKAND